MKNNSNNFYKTLPYKNQSITEFDGVLSPWKYNVKSGKKLHENTDKVEGLILHKLNNFQAHMVRYRTPGEDIFLYPKLFIAFFLPQYLYLCDLFNVEPFSAEAAGLFSLRWHNFGEKGLPITRNTVVWHGPFGFLKNQYTQKSVEDQYVTAGFLHQHLFNLAKNDGERLVKKFNLKMPYINKKVLKCFRISTLNQDIEDRQVSIEKNHTTGLYYFKEWDPFKDPKPEHYHTLSSFKDVAKNYVDPYTMKVVNKQLSVKDRGFDNLLNKTGHKHLERIKQELGLDEVKALRTLMEANPHSTTFAEATEVESMSDLAKSLRLSRENAARYKVVDHYGYPVSQDGETFARLSHFFTRYTEGSLRGAIYSGRKIKQAGKIYYISMAGGDMSRLPEHIRDRNKGVETNLRVVENLLRPHVGTSLSKATATVYGLAGCRYTTKEISAILDLQPSEVENHIDIADNVLSRNQTPPSISKPEAKTSEVIDRSLYAFGKLPQMKDYKAEIFDTFNDAPVNPNL